MRTGQASVGLIVGLGVLLALVAVLAGAVAAAVPLAWQGAVDERAQARQRLLGSDRELQPRWRRAGGGDGDRIGRER